MSSLRTPLKARARRTAERTVNGARKATPDRMLPLVARTRARMEKRNDAKVARARREMDFLTGMSNRVTTPLDELADRYLDFDAWRAEVRWHPALISHQEIEGLEHVMARADGRGTIFTFLHHGIYEGAIASLGYAGVPRLRCVVASLMVSDDAPAFLRQHFAVGSASGAEYISADHGARPLIEALQEGCTVGIATDVPGRHEVTFGGRPVTGSFGAAHIAAKTNTPVVMMTAHPDADNRPCIKLSEPWEPSDFASPDDLVEAMLRHHEPAALAWPEAYHQPTLRWGVPGESPAR